MIELLDKPFSAPEALEAFAKRASGAGAIVSFTGLVRPEATSGPVKALYLQAYEPLTQNSIAKALQEAKSRWPITHAHIIHRIGQMSPSETIVFVATASAHRRAAFAAADFLMDYLKTDAIFWKKEASATGDSWIEPRAEDYKDRARWALQKED